MLFRILNFLLIILYVRLLELGYLDKFGLLVSLMVGELFYVVKKKVCVVIVFFNSFYNLNLEVRR